MKHKTSKVVLSSLFFLIIFATGGCKSSFYKKVGTDIATGESYNHSYEKKCGMTKWEYEQKLKRDQEQFEEEQAQFNSMRNQ